MKALLIRINSNYIEMLGKFALIDDKLNDIFVCKTLELPWKNNQHQISCIPTGTYDVVPRFSPEHGQHFHVINVPDRDMILIHEGNYHFNFLGCIGVGQDFSDMNKDGQTDITNTKATLAQLVKVAPNGFRLTIK